MKNNYPTDSSVGLAMEALREIKRESQKIEAIKPYMIGVGFVFVVIGFELMRQVSWKVAVGVFLIWWAQNIFRKFK